MSLKLINKNCLRSVSNCADKNLNRVTGTPIVVLDLRTNERFEFSSISEAARYFNTYPKTIWRIVYGNKLYKGHFEIIAKNNKKGLKENKIYKNLYDVIQVKISSIYKGIKDNNLYSYYILSLLILGLIVYIFIYYFLLMYKEVYSEYITTMHNIKYNRMKYVLEHGFTFKCNTVNDYKVILSNNKINRFIETNKELRFDAKLGIYQSIINEINLDFTSGTSSSTINSSPIIERIDLNDVFNTLVVKTAPIPDTINNSYLSINSNRNSLTLNTSIEALSNKPRNMELLNYNSNILYLLINKLSPSLY